MALYQESIERNDNTDFVPDLDKVVEQTLNQTSTGLSKFGGPVMTRGGASGDLSIVDDGIMALAAKPVALGYMTMRAMEGSSNTSSIFMSNRNNADTTTHGSLHINYETTGRGGKAAKKTVSLVEPGYFEARKLNKTAQHEDIIMRSNIASMSLGSATKGLKSPSLHIKLTKEQKNTIESVQKLKDNPSAKRLASELRKDNQEAKNFMQANWDSADVHQAVKMTVGVSPEKTMR